MGRLTSFALVLVAAAAPAMSAPLTVAAGESWAFALKGGDPVRARRVPANSKPLRGEIKVSVSRAMGTTMIVTNATAQAYTFTAELIGAPASQSRPRTCTLPPKLPTLESWPVKSTAVRLSNFRPAKDGSCN